MANQRAWRSNVNNPLPNTATSSTTLRQSIMWAIVKMLTGGLDSGEYGEGGAIPAGYRWIVVGSSDGVTAGMDGVDRWTDYTKLVYGTNFAWMVLRHPVSGMYLLFRFNLAFTTVNNVAVVMGRNAPVGGGVSTEPAFSGGVVALASKYFGATSTSTTWPAGGMGHITMSETGGCMVMITQMAGGGDVYFGMLEIEQDGETLDLCPWAVALVGFATGFDNGAAIFGASTSTTGMPMMGTITHDGTTGTDAQFVAPRVDAAILDSASKNFPGTNRCKKNLKFDAFPALVYANGTGHEGLKGRVIDFDLVPESSGHFSRWPALGTMERLTSGILNMPFVAVPVAD